MSMDGKMGARSPDHHAVLTLSTGTETRRLHLPPEQTEGSSSSAALEHKSFNVLFRKKKKNVLS